MLIAHSFEIGGWAVFYMLTGMLEDPGSAMNFSINAYTTLGASPRQSAAALAGPGRGRGDDRYADVRLVHGGCSSAP